MANIQLFENYPWFLVQSSTFGVGSVPVQGVYIEGNLSVRSVVVGYAHSSTSVDNGLTFSVGIYSRNAGTLSLYLSASNTASFSASAGAGAFSWLSLAVTSNTLSAGNWYLAAWSSTSGGSGWYPICNQGTLTHSSTAYGGVFVHGALSFSTDGLPESMVTGTDLEKQGESEIVASVRHPYVLLSA